MSNVISSIAQPDCLPRRYDAPDPGGQYALHSSRDTIGISSWDIRARAALCILVGALTFNLVLCFVNTNVLGISRSHVVAMEMLLLGSAALVALDRRPELYVCVSAVLSYLFFIMALRSEIDAKAARDIMLPIIFYFMGRKIASPVVGDRIVTFSIYTVLAFALFEWFFLSTFLQIFNVVDYYIARGSLSATETKYLANDLFVSGNRPEGEGRTILPFLGNHRVSSVFLEPVSVGNFCAVAMAWTLFRERRFTRGLVLRVVPILAIVTLADSRFGLSLCVAIVIARICWRAIPRWAIFLGPFAIMVILAIYAADKSMMDVDNGFHGRVVFSGLVLKSLEIDQIFGVGTNPQQTVDSGYAYSLAETGLIGVAGLWALLIFMPTADPRGWAMKVFAACYLMAIMIVSNSAYSIKTAALLWTLIGIAAAMPPASRSEARVKRNFRTG